MSADDVIESPGRARRAQRLAATTVAMAAYYTRPIRRTVGDLRHRSDRIVLNRAVPNRTGPDGIVVTLRMPRFADGPDWRRIRLRDQARIESFWVSDGGDWARRHSDRVWARHCLDAWSRARTGTAYEWVVDIDGTLVGQCSLWVEAADGRGEIGGWLSEQWGRRGVATTAIGAMVDFAFAELGLSRIVAPIDPANEPMLRLIRRLDFVCEGTMTSYLAAAGRRRDCLLWALTVDRWTGTAATAE
ncbi:GNAT family N-acetyltransferase [Skermania piniformis]|uniref:GNAT family N-acetyltransferase n=1 Tax=Skermania pinensis TaxID=39122 RepID=A0ABX8S5F7_9ACTN|nr:GNAT family protein [Skermania piniformis]QXQ13073.1 GNAT family N-acetyltransferase [Skermania piniformis]